MEFDLLPCRCQTLFQLGLQVERAAVLQPLNSLGHQKLDFQLLPAVGALSHMPKKALQGGIIHLLGDKIRNQSLEAFAVHIFFSNPCIQMPHPLHRSKKPVWPLPASQASSACAMSAIRSSLSSMPQLILISSAGTPASRSCSSVICLWVLEAGFRQHVRASAT